MQSPPEPGRPSPVAPVRMHPVSIDGVRSPVRECGPAGAREAVVFVHGNPGSGEDWLDLLAQVGTFARAIAPDMPGFGKADRPRSLPYTIEGYAAHLAGLLTALGVERAHLVLHDFGGPWGLAWGCAHPSAVASLTLVNTGALPGYKMHRMAKLWRTPVVGELVQWMVTRRMMGRDLDRTNPRPLPPAFVDRMFGDMDAGMKRAVLKLYRSTGDPDEQLRLLAPLTAARVPTLVLWGEGDPYIPVRYAEEQRRFFDVKEVHTLPGCGHWPFVDDPAGVAGWLVPFLKLRVGSGSS